MSRLHNSYKTQRLSYKFNRDCQQSLAGRLRRRDAVWHGIPQTKFENYSFCSLVHAWIIQTTYDTFRFWRFVMGDFIGFGQSQANVAFPAIYASLS